MLAVKATLLLLLFHIVRETLLREKSLQIRPLRLKKYQLRFRGRGVINIWQTITKFQRGKVV